MIATPLADTALDMEQLAAEIAAENHRRYAFLRMLTATDRVLWRLEELNRDDVRVLPKDMRARMRASLAELPDTIRNRFAETGSVQVALDSVFDLQDALFRWHDPLREPADEEELREIEPPGLRERILERLRANPGGLTSNELARNTQPWDKDVRRMLPSLVADGAVRFEDGPRHTQGQRRRLYFLAGERGGGE